MNKVSQMIADRRESYLKYFFGEDVKLSGGKHDTLLDFTHVIDRDNIIIITNNIEIMKHQYILVIGDNKVVWLKDWQVQELKYWDVQLNTYAVKLNRQYFKPYELKFKLDKYCFNGREHTFDSLYELAVSQDNATQKIEYKFGHYNL